MLVKETPQYTQIFDLRTGKIIRRTFLPGQSRGRWITQDTLVAATREETTKFVTFDFKTQKWSELVAGDFVNWEVSPDRQVLYFTTGGAEPKAQRLRFADRQIETITGLKDLRRVEDSVEGATQVNVAPDGSRCSPATSAPRKSMRSRSSGRELSPRASHSEVPFPEIDVVNRPYRGLIRSRAVIRSGR